MSSNVSKKTPAEHETLVAKQRRDPTTEEPMENGESFPMPISNTQPLTEEPPETAVGEPRSSSGECTSGESKTAKADGTGENGRDGSSLKDSGSQSKAVKAADVDKDSGEGSNGKTLLDDSTKDGSVATNELTGLENVKDKANRPKLPRPEGTCQCPRCGSEDTKFCYYNNYNIKQPRYYCKGCQRYWTAGGMLRNVPVGAGRRSKNAKNDTTKLDKNGMPAIANPLGPPLGAAGAYAHNRHVLWDPADAGLQDSPMARHSDPYQGRPPGYMQAGLHPMYMPRVLRHPRLGPQTPHMSVIQGTANFSSASSMNSTRSYGGHDLKSTDTAGQGSTVDPSCATATDSPNRGRQKMRKLGPESPQPKGIPAYMAPQGGALPPDYDRQFSNAAGCLHVGHDAADVDGSEPASPGEECPDNRGHQSSGDEGWVIPSHPSAAAAAAYHAASGQHQPGYWSGMPPWHYPWGNSAVAGWAAAAAAVYHAGANSCWHPNNPGWSRMESPAMNGPVSGSVPVLSANHLPQGGHPSSNFGQPGYPGPIVGYPGPSGPWPSWGNMPPGAQNNPNAYGMMPLGPGMHVQGPMVHPPGPVVGMHHHSFNTQISPGNSRRGSAVVAREASTYL